MNWCDDPDPVPDEPWISDPECGSCGHKMSCHDQDDECWCGDDEDERS